MRQNADHATLLRCSNRPQPWSFSWVLVLFGTSRLWGCSPWAMRCLELRPRAPSKRRTRALATRTPSSRAASLVAAANRWLVNLAPNSNDDHDNMDDSENNHENIDSRQQQPRQLRKEKTTQRLETKSMTASIALLTLTKIYNSRSDHHHKRM